MTHANHFYSKFKHHIQHASAKTSIYHCDFNKSSLQSLVMWTHPCLVLSTVWMPLPVRPTLIVSSVILQHSEGEFMYWSKQIDHPTHIHSEYVVLVPFRLGREHTHKVCNSFFLVQTVAGPSSLFLYRFCYRDQHAQHHHFVLRVPWLPSSSSTSGMRNIKKKHESVHYPVNEWKHTGERWRHTKREQVWWRIQFTVHFSMLNVLWVFQALELQLQMHL